MVCEHGLRIQPEQGDGGALSLVAAQHGARLAAGASGQCASAKTLCEIGHIVKNKTSMAGGLYESGGHERVLRNHAAEAAPLENQACGQQLALQQGHCLWFP